MRTAGDIHLVNNKKTTHIHQVVKIYEQCFGKRIWSELIVFKCWLGGGDLFTQLGLSVDEVQWLIIKVDVICRCHRKSDSPTLWYPRGEIPRMFGIWIPNILGIEYPNILGYPDILGIWIPNILPSRGIWHPLISPCTYRRFAALR